MEERIIKDINNLLTQLFQKMKEAGYVWDAEKKELMKIEQNSSWSEEDEKLYTSALWHIKNSCGNGGKDSGEYEVYNWLKSLKDRVQPQPKQEWCEDDEKMLDSIIDCLDGLCFTDPNQLNWLKSLKPNHWKPSDEQMEALNAINNVGELSYAGQADLLIRLYNNLKKL